MSRPSLTLGAFMMSLLVLLPLAAPAQEPTPPVKPKLQEVQLPPPVEIPPPPTIPEFANRPLTAIEAAAIALLHQPAVAFAKAGVATAEARTAQVRSGLGAVIGVAATATEADDFGGNGPFAGLPSAYQFSATVSRLLYDLNHTRDLVRQQQALERVAGANLNTTQLDLILQVKQAFYKFLQALRLVSVKEASVKNQQAHLALADARLKSGLGLPYDVVRAEAAVAEAVYGLTSARRDASRARVSLAELMGIDPRTPLQAAQTGEAVVAPDNVQESVDLGLGQRPEMRQAQAAVDASRHAIAAARTTNSPTVTGSVGVQRRGDTLFDEPNAITVGVGVQWTPFDSGFTKARVREAEAGLEANQAQLEAVRLQIIADVSQAYLDLKAAEQGVATAQTQVANAEEALRLAEGRYRAGIGVFIDVLDAQTALESASTNLVNAQTGVDQARAAHARATGADLAHLAQEQAEPVAPGAEPVGSQN